MPRRQSLRGLSTSGFHEIVYWEWGDVNNPNTIVMVHGLTRQGRDFDRLAASLASKYRVVCPDVVGRGKSGWLRDPAGYGFPQYMADMNALVARLGCAKVDWLGTSMGGLIGMMLAAMPDTPIRRLILNDVGPHIPKAALERIGDYLGAVPRFETVQEVEAHLRLIHAPFGPLSDREWQHLTEHSLRRLPDGGYALAYDPGIAKAFHDNPTEDVDLWPVWDQIKGPVLTLRGARSDLLLADTAQEMKNRGPRSDLIEFTDCGHAPALMDDAQIGIVEDWLSRTA